MLCQKSDFRAKRMVTLMASFHATSKKVIRNVIYSCMEDEDAQVQKHQQLFRSSLPEEATRLRAERIAKG